MEWSSGTQDLKFYQTFSILPSLKNSVITFDEKNIKKVLSKRCPSSSETVAKRVNIHYRDSLRHIKRAFGISYNDDFQQYCWGLVLTVDLGLTRDKVECLLQIYCLKFYPRLTRRDYTKILGIHSSFRYITDSNKKLSKRRDLTASWDIHADKKETSLPTISKAEFLRIIDVNEIDIVLDVDALTRDMLAVDERANHLNKLLTDDPIINGSLNPMPKSDQSSVVTGQSAKSAKSHKSSVASVNSKKSVISVTKRIKLIDTHHQSGSILRSHDFYSNDKSDLVSHLTAPSHSSNVSPKAHERKVEKLYDDELFLDEKASSVYLQDIAEEKMRGYFAVLDENPKIRLFPNQSLRNRMHDMSGAEIVEHKLHIDELPRESITPTLGETSLDPLEESLMNNFEDTGDIAPTTFVGADVDIYGAGKDSLGGSVDELTPSGAYFGDTEFVVPEEASPSVVIEDEAATTAVAPETSKVFPTHSIEHIIRFGKF